LETRRRRFESQKQDPKKPAPLTLNTVKAPEVSSVHVFDGIPSALLDWCVRDDHNELKDDEIEDDPMLID